MANLLPILLLGGAAAVVLGKKKKKKKAPPEPEPPDEFPILTDEPEPEPEPGEAGGDEVGPEPGKAVASGVERHFTGAYLWKILFTEQRDYAAHYYSMSYMGPHEEVARGTTVEEAIEAFKFWAINEDRRKRNLPPLFKAHATASSGAKTATFFVPEDEGDGTGDFGN